MSRLVAAGGVLVLLAGIGVVAVQSRDSARAFDEQAAVEAFRSAAAVPSASAAPVGSPAGSVPASRAAAPAPTARPASAVAEPGIAAEALPAPRATAPAGGPTAGDEVPSGVYRYETSGYEQVDLLGGARHDYPSTSTITYSRTGCGSEERWQPLEGRIGVARQCDGADGSEVRETYQEREFFGQRESKTLTCDPGVLLRPRQPRPGATWTGRCRGGGTTADLTTRLVGVERLDVGGTSVEVLHLRIAGALSGSTRGRSDREVWLRRTDGLLVRALGSTDTDADTSGGTVRYQEEYELRLRSVTPRR